MKLNENTKVTLTLEQLRKLVGESRKFDDLVEPEEGAISPRPWRVKKCYGDDRVCIVLDAMSNVILSDVRGEDADLIVRLVNKEV